MPITASRAPSPRPNAAGSSERGAPNVGGGPLSLGQLATARVRDLRVGPSELVTLQPWHEGRQAERRDVHAVDVLAREVRAVDDAGGAALTEPPRADGVAAGSLSQRRLNLGNAFGRTATPPSGAAACSHRGAARPGAKGQAVSGVPHDLRRGGAWSLGVFDPSGVATPRAPVGVGQHSGGSSRYAPEGRPEAS